MANLQSKNGRQRRELLKQFAAISLLGSGASAMNGKLSLIGSALAQSADYSDIQDYKALVCVFLYGGSDSFSMFVPTDAARYEQYAAGRGGLVIPADELLTGAVDTGIGFHPLLGGLHGMYETGELAVVANVGNLIEPITRDNYLSGNLPIPNDLFAHNHQQEQWLKGLSSSPASVVGSGWGGRMADLLQQANPTATLPPSFSVNGSNYWLPGQQIQPLSLNPVNGLSLLTYLDDQTGLSSNRAREQALDLILGQSSDHALMQQAASSFSGAKFGSGQLAATLADTVNIDAPYDEESRLAQQLRMVARLIAGNRSLGMKRQIFFVGAGGWDTHDNQTPRLAELLADLDRSLTDFQATLAEIGASNSVTTFTASDFGRTVTINGDGSDHGWGGHCMVMGGAVNGGQLFGELPSFAVDADDDSGDKGRIIPSLSINQYGAMMARWMGVTETDLNQVFPDLSNFGEDWWEGLDFLNQV